MATSGPEQIFNMVLEMFDRGGANFGSITFNIPQNMHFTVSRNRDTIRLDFVGKKPRIKWRWIPTPFRVAGVVFRDDGGTVRIDNWSDVDFSYETL